MQQLTGLDQMFFALDTQTTNAVLGGLVLFEPLADGQRGPDAAFMRKRLHERLPLIPPMNKRVVQVPFALDYGYLAVAHRVDLTEHIRTLTLPEPGDDRELAAEVSRLMSSPFRPADMKDSPLWDLTIIDGLANGSMAMLLRIHHGVVDGSTMPAIWDLFSDEPRADLTDVHEALGTLPEPYVGDAEMFVRAITGTLKRPLTWTQFQINYVKWLAERYPEDGLFTIPGQLAKMLPGQLGKLATNVLNVRQRAVGQQDIAPYMPKLVPPATPFNGRTSAQRHFVYSEMNLAEVKAVGKRMGATLNNVVVAICAGAIRRYMEERGGPLDEPLVVCCPVSLRHEDLTDPWANHVHMMFAPFPTHLADPIERVESVTKDLTVAKSSFDSMPTKLFREASNFMPRDLLHLATEAWIRMPDKLSRAPWNVVVSNVRGPSEPATMNGLKVHGYWPASFLSIGGGINITLQSYVDRICFGFIGAPEKTGDLWPLVDYMEESLRELQQAVDAKEAAAGGTARPRAGSASTASAGKADTGKASTGSAETAGTGRAAASGAETDKASGRRTPGRPGRRPRAATHAASASAVKESPRTATESAPPVKATKPRPRRARKSTGPDDGPTIRVVS